MSAASLCLSINPLPESDSLQAYQLGESSGRNGCSFVGCAWRYEEGAAAGVYSIQYLIKSRFINLLSSWCSYVFLYLYRRQCSHAFMTAATLLHFYCWLLFLIPEEKCLIAYAVLMFYSYAFKLFQKHIHLFIFPFPFSSLQFLLHIFSLASCFNFHPVYISFLIFHLSSLIFLAYIKRMPSLKLWKSLEN